jgi:Flp pilus assembly protein TadG
MFSSPSNRNRRRGATTVEMAVVSMVLFALIFGGIEITRIASLRQSAEYASYLGARQGIISGATAADVKTAAENHLTAVSIKKAKVKVTPSTITDKTKTVVVEVTIPIADNSWGVPTFLTTSLKGQSTLLTERPSAMMQ